MSQLNAALERKNVSERKINSTKRYNRASEDPISAAKALRTRKAISNTNDFWVTWKPQSRYITAQTAF